MNIEENLLELYMRDYEIEWYSYHMMGKLLESKWVKKRVELYNLQSLYIYGGGYLGVQLYKAVEDMVNIKAVVDKNGSLSVDIEDIRVISLDDLRKEYSSEKIIITPMKYYRVIQNDLLEFIDKDNILFLGEFLEGIVL